MKKTEQEAINAYVSEVEGAQPTPETSYVPEAPVTPMAEAARNARLHGRADLPTAETTGLNYRDNLGYLKIDVKTLPTQGLFYPEGTEISIRAARGGEIKHWSTMKDQDLN